MVKDEKMMKRNSVTGIDKQRTFSVVIPMFNASKTIAETLDSCVTQTQLPKEVIIVDDCSRDDSVEVVKRWMDRYSGEVSIVVESLKENSGPSKARNRGWELSGGDYIAFLDADDRFLPEKLERVAVFLAQHNDAVLLGHAWMLEGEAKKTSGSVKSVSKKEILFRNLATTPSIVVKREIGERFDETMHYTEDHDLWLRITERYDRSFFLDTVLTQIGRAVRSEGGQSANLWAMRRGEMKMYAKYCRRNGAVWQFPFFVLYSAAKHTYRWIKGT